VAPHANVVRSAAAVPAALSAGIPSGRFLGFEDAIGDLGNDRCSDEVEPPSSCESIFEDPAPRTRAQKG
jgi:hypothetical protein